MPDKNTKFIIFVCIAAIVILILTVKAVLIMSNMKTRLKESEGGGNYFVDTSVSSIIPSTASVGGAISVAGRQKQPSNIVNFPNSQIPAVVIQTYKTKSVPQGMRAAVDSIRTHNSNSTVPITYMFFDDKECQDFLETCEDVFPGVTSTFNTIKPGAFKADVFRLAALYIYGGFYIDITMNYSEDIFSGYTTLENIASKICGPDVDLLIVKDISSEKSSVVRKNSIYQAFIGVKKGHPFIKYCLINIIDRILSRPKINIGQTLWISGGPNAFGEFILKYYNLRNFKELLATKSKTVRVFNLCISENRNDLDKLNIIKYINKENPSGLNIIKTKYNNWHKDRGGMNSHYQSMTINGDVYEKTKIDISDRVEYYTSHKIKTPTYNFSEVISDAVKIFKEDTPFKSKPLGVIVNIADCEALGIKDALRSGQFVESYFGDPLLPTKLASNCAVLIKGEEGLQNKEETWLMERLLKPYIHYLPYDIPETITTTVHETVSKISSEYIVDQFTDSAVEDEIIKKVEYMYKNMHSL